MASSAFAGEALDRVISAGTLKVATDANWAPQSFINDDNKMDGFDVDRKRPPPRFQLYTATASVRLTC
jgi:polar amino acid transport system substrate-binding protein